MALNSAFSFSGLLEPVPAPPAPADDTEYIGGSSFDSLKLAALVLQILNAQPSRTISVMGLVKEVSRKVDIGPNEFQTLLETLLSLGWIVREGDVQARDYLVRAVK